MGGVLTPRPPLYPPLLVQSSTTDRGTLIDHVYYNRPSDDAVVQVHDTYYSDHDTLLCSCFI